MDRPLLFIVTLLGVGGALANWAGTGHHGHNKEQEPADYALPNAKDHFERVKRPLPTRESVESETIDDEDPDYDNYPDHKIFLELNIHHKFKGEEDRNSYMKVNVDSSDQWAVDEKQENPEGHSWNPWTILKEKLFKKDKDKDKEKKGSDPSGWFDAKVWHFPEDEDEQDLLICAVGAAAVLFVLVLVACYCVRKRKLRKRSQRMANLEVNAEDLRGKSPVFFVHPYDKTFMSIANGRWSF